MEIAGNRSCLRRWRHAGWRTGVTDLDLLLIPEAHRPSSRDGDCDCTRYHGESDCSPLQPSCSQPALADFAGSPGEISDIATSLSTFRVFREQRSQVILE
ncbi:hypothetical protein H9L21_15060 [Aeromicrobium senzhongii]|uniref:Uncharacterized protein n=1 Tax=Aeromicrobium senzhongii TaxID=2663859 RepID=A0ABX6SSJ1_9ACTN|nr:hypothetical protein [Aeromicrobium senzhongii]MTB89493.1 hypothetical protein [Aeromicrobium senzhongii]QNL94373.1 hypothetical protein H9L21_15060 [Aeromicrobium senzhongii]